MATSVQRQRLDGVATQLAALGLCNGGDVHRECAIDTFRGAHAQLQPRRVHLTPVRCQQLIVRLSNQHSHSKYLYRHRLRLCTSFKSASIPRVSLITGHGLLGKHLSGAGIQREDVERQGMTSTHIFFDCDAL